MDCALTFKSLIPAGLGAPTETGFVFEQDVSAAAKQAINITVTMTGVLAGPGRLLRHRRKFIKNESLLSRLNFIINFMV
jgi:hypothetical protein